jgi:hypothetical protein
MKNKLKLKIQKLQIEKNIFIFNSIIDSLDRHYNFLCQNYEPKLTDTFLHMFQEETDFTYTSIQNNFKIFILTHSKITPIQELGYKGGVYFIYDAEDILLYIGKSHNIEKRVVESFINKLPYGSCYFKIAAPEYMNQIDIWEAVAIDFYKPALNQKSENLKNITHRYYSQILIDIIQQITTSDKQNISISQLDYTIEVFNQIDDVI